MAFDDGVKTVSGSIAHTDDAATKVPFVSVKCGIEPTLDGVTEIDAVRPDGNILQTVATSKTQNGITWTVNADGSVTLEGTSTARTYLYVHNYHKILPKDATLTVSVEGLKDNGTSDVFVNLPYSDNGTTYSGSYGQVTWGTPKKTISYTADKYIGFYIDCPANVTTNQTVKIMVTIGSEAQTFEPYVSPVTHNVELGRTIYGGKPDIVNGEGQETYKKIVLDGSLNWAEQSVGNIDARYYIGGITYDAENLDATGVSNMGALVTSFTSDGITVQSNGRVSLCGSLHSQYASVYDLKNALNLNPLVIVYKLATPTDFTFTPITPTPETVGKVNNVYCNTGDTELTYYDNAHGFSEVTVNKTGKNLFDISKVATTGTTAGISWSVSGNEITISGTATSSGWKTLVDFKLPHKGTYHFHMNATGNVGYFLRGWTQLVGKDITEVCNDPSQTYRIAIAVATSGQSYSGTISEIQIEVGDSYTEYEPYEAVSKTAYLHKVIYGGKADVVRGTCKPKNLLKLYLYRTSHLGVNFSLTDDGLLHMEGTNTSTTGSAFSGGNYSTYDDCPWKFSAGTYTASSIVSADLSKIGSVNLLIRTKSDNVQTAYYLKDAPKTFTVNEDFGALFWASVLKTETVNCDVGVQLEKGSTASDFAPYFEPFSFPPISMSTDEGENTLFANEGGSAIVYRKEST